jgi:Family of unknown function (DUF5694)
MKLIKLICLLLFTFSSLYAQQKTKIVLVGTMHFESSESDMYKNEAVDMKNAARQKQIKEVVDKFVDFKPDQVCVEWVMSKQLKLDSLYKAFLEGTYKLEDNEIDQLGMNSAKAAGLKQLTAINRLGSFDSDTVMKYASQNEQTAILQQMDVFSKEFIGEINGNMAKLSVKDFLIYINSKKALQTNLGFYLKYMAKIGKGKDYVGSKLTADWYTTNLNIYTNILRVVKPTDKAILVIFGQGHVPILKHLFENNDDFEVVEVATILK